MKIKNKQKDLTCEYLCLNCEHKWKEVRPRIFNKEELVSCPLCEYHLVKWVNYNKLFGE